MAKYIVCMLLGALLMLGVVPTPDKELQGFLTEIGTTNIQPDHNLTTLSESEAYSIDNQGYTHDIGEVIPVSPISVRSMTPFKLLRFNQAISVVQKLSTLDSDLARKRWKAYPSDTSLTQNSYRYFVYTLKRLLI